MTVSVALIAKNEEQGIRRCLESVRDGVDEIVVVDTGSNDRTKEVARELGARVYDFGWRDDFAAARQFSFDRATGDWIVWLDADDVVLHADRIRACLADASPGIGGFYWKYIYGQDEYGNATCVLWRERCVRNDGSFRWVGRVHEVLVATRPTGLERSDDVVVVHHRDPARRGDPLRNLAILQDEYARRPVPEPRLLLYLGNEYADVGQPHQAITFLDRYVRVSTWEDEKYLAQVRIAGLQRQLGAYEAAIDAALGALKILPRWPHAYFSLAQTYYFLRDWPKVVHWAELGQKLPEPETVCILNPMDWKYEWIIHYTNALYHTHRVAEALEWTQRALALRPGDAWHTANLRFFAQMLGDNVPRLRPPRARRGARRSN